MLVNLISRHSYEYFATFKLSTKRDVAIEKQIRFDDTRVK